MKSDESQELKTIAVNNSNNNNAKQVPKTSQELIGRSELNLIINYVNSWNQR